MRLKQNKRIYSWLLCMMLIVAMALMTVGCSTKKQVENNQLEAVTQETTDNNQPEAVTQEMADNDQSEVVTQENGKSTDNVLGVGQTMFLFTVVDKDGNETDFEIHTDKETVGEALLDLELIAGEDGDFGLYVKTVNGITADYEVDQTYWAFYVDGEYAMSGVDTTTIEEGKTYAFKVEK